MESQYVRAVYHFPTTERGEIPLHCGDVVLLLYQVDDNWLCGKLRGQVGNFPVNFVEPVSIPQTELGEKLFCAVEDFPNVMSGDLPFKRGDVVVGMKAVDKSWWHGRCGDLYGMFPVTHVRQIDTAPPGEYVRQGEAAAESGGKIPEHVPGHPENQSMPNSLEVENIEGDVIAKGYANMDLEAQYSDELSFNKGDIVSVIKVIDSDFAVGECRGRKGSFPLSFVDMFEGEVTSPVATETKKSKFRWWEEEAAGTVSKGNHGDRSDTSVMSALPDVQFPVVTNNNAQNVSLGATKVSHVNLTTLQPDGLPVMSQESARSNSQYTDRESQGLSTQSTSYNGAVKSHRRTGSYTLENTRSYDSTVTPYGKTLFPFVAENHNELSFFDNEIVTLIQHVDDQWMEGEIEGTTGIFPASYIEVIVDCPWPEDSKAGNKENMVSVTSSTTGHLYQDGEIIDDRKGSSSSKEATNGSEYEGSFVSLNAQYGRVVSAFTPDNLNDLSFREGELVTIIQQADEHWFEVQTESGQFGFCPVSYVEVIEHLANDEAVTEPTKVIPKEEGMPEIACNDESKKMMQSQNGIIKSDKNAEENTVSTVSSDIQSTIKQAKPVISLISTKPKPAIKPKPQLKPKPDTVKFLNNNNALAKAPTGEGVLLAKPESTIQRAHSCDIFSRQSSDEGVTLSRQNSEGSVSTSPPAKTRPQRPTIPPTQRGQPAGNDYKPQPSRLPPPKPSTGPVFVRTDSFTTKSSNLDTIIEDQMKAAKVEAETRSRSSSMLSDASSSTSSTGSSTQPPIPPRKCDRQKQMLPPTPPRNYGALRELQNTAHQEQKPSQERKVAASTFYVDSGSSLFPPVSQVSAAQSQPFPVGGQTTRESRQVEPPRSLHGAGGDGNRPVPQRKAPPRPSHVGRGESPGDLMAFSPSEETGSPDAEQVENSEVTSDLDRRIREIEDDIQAYTKNKNELERFLTKHHGDTAEEKLKVQENLDFTTANIQGLTEELNQLRESLYQLRPERKALDQERESQAEKQRILVEEQRRRDEVEKRHQEETIQRRRETRKRVIQELIQTEKDYLRSITVCHDTFFDPDFPRHHMVDMDQLFGNMEEVIDLSQRLLSALEESTQGKEFEQQKIGECFVMLKKEMTRVYAPYCKNHDDVLQLLEKYDETPEVQMYINAGIELIKDQMTVFDLGSVLIKPVQRILKYPLLLNELIKNTEEDHPDKFHLLGAITCMTQVAATINEFKRRKDLVKKYKVEKKEDLGDKLARLNVHSTKKKLSRLSQKMVGPLTVDEKFKGEERKFKNLEMALRVLVRNVSQYIDHIQESTSSLEMVANDLSDYYAEKGYIPKIERYCQVTNHIATKLCYRFRQQIEMQVIHPLNRLLVLFMAPNKVIKKRHDKLLDYDNIRSKSTGSEVEMAKRNYEALNAQLIEELPQLYRLCLDLVKDCLIRLVGAQKQFHEDGLNEMYKLLGLDLVLSTDQHEFMEHFLLAHTQVVEKLSDLSFIPKSFNPRLEEKKGQGVKGRRSSEYKSSGSSSPVTSSRQSETQKQQVIQQYPVDRVYSVIQDYPGGAQMDLTVCQGWVVAVLKEGDPMGNKDRWFVDNGVGKGFVPKSCLTLYSPQKPRSGSFTADLLTDDPFLDTQCQSTGMPSKNEDIFDPIDSPSFSQSSVSSHLSPATNYQSGSVLQPQPASGQSHPSILDQDQNGSIHRPLPSQSDDVSPNSATIADLDRDTDFMDDQLDDVEYYQAVYGFTARTELELTLTEGHYVKVVDKHDLEGNEEWWLVEADGQRGYAPANYIEKVQ